MATRPLKNDISPEIKQPLLIDRGVASGLGTMGRWLRCYGSESVHESDPLTRELFTKSVNCWMR